MKFIFTKHAKEKFALLASLGWIITESKVKKTINNPVWEGTSKHGDKTAMSLMDQKHITERLRFRCRPSRKQVF